MGGGGQGCRNQALWAGSPPPGNPEPLGASEAPVLPGTHCGCPRVPEPLRAMPRLAGAPGWPRHGGVEGCLCVHGPVHVGTEEGCVWALLGVPEVHAWGWACMWLWACPPVWGAGGAFTPDMGCMPGSECARGGHLGWVGPQRCYFRGSGLRHAGPLTGLDPGKGSWPGFYVTPC